MNSTTTKEELALEQSVIHSLLDVGAVLYECRDQREVIETILFQARTLTNAEAGSVYLVRGDRLQFLAVQNDRVGPERIAEHLLGEEMLLSERSLAGHVAISGRIVNIPDRRHVPSDLPFCINLELQAKAMYPVRSILAIPLK